METVVVGFGMLFCKFFLVCRRETSTYWLRCQIDTGTVQNTMYRDQIWQLKTNNFQKKNNCF